MAKKEGTADNSELSAEKKEGFYEVKEDARKHNYHPALRRQLTFGQKASDKLTQFAGSWQFIISLFVLMFVWITINIYGLAIRKWDPYPFILLNFVLSTLAAIQAPIILMSQNRQAERDRINFKYDYQVNRRAEREVTKMQKDLDKIIKMVKNFKKDWETNIKAEKEISKVDRKINELKRDLKKKI